MGVSTDGILFYGFCWGDKHDLDEAGEGWVSVIHKRRGLPDPFANRERFREKKPGEDYWAYDKAQRAALDAWFKANDAAVKSHLRDNEAIREEFGCDIGGHCSGEYSMPYVYIVDSMVVAGRGYPKDVSGKSLGEKPEWDALLAKFMDELGIERPHPLPRWWLVSYWG